MSRNAWPILGLGALFAALVTLVVVAVRRQRKDGDT